MTLNQKIIKPKIGLLELAKSLGKVSAACKTTIVEIVTTALKNSMSKEENKLFMK
jgi:hypothetical protein